MANQSTAQWVVSRPLGRTAISVLPAHLAGRDRELKDISQVGDSFAVYMEPDGTLHDCAVYHRQMIEEMGP